MQDDTDGEHWVDLIRAFGGAKDFRVGVGIHVTGILCALGLADGEHSTVLPALRTLHVPELGPMRGSSWEAVESFTTSRRLSGHPVEVLPSLNIPGLNANKGKPNTPQQYTCTACDVGFTNRQGLNRHNGDKHMPRNVCPHCGVFKWSQARNYLFRKHLESKHPEVAHTDALIYESNPALQSFPSSHSDHLGARKDLRATDIFEPPLTPPNTF
ncbi:hypothetical protein EDB84DRAFT_1469404 [Lactarius hengduanensis]|nr:hypothetical protein EDB84DRAFT_1469404 [Lactarius hengduanensis]